MPSDGRKPVVDVALQGQTAGFAGAAQERQRVLSKLRISDQAFHHLTRGAALLVLIILGGVIVALVHGSSLALSTFGLDFVTTQSWNPVTEKFGALAPIYGTLVTSLIADLAKLAARRFILGPIANALSGALGGAGGIFANILHAGGMVGSTGPSRVVPAMAFTAAPRMHSGGAVGLRHDEVPAILQRGERVLSRREAQSYGAGGGINVTIMARDAESFRQSRTQVAADIARAVSLGRRGM